MREPLNYLRNLLRGNRYTHDQDRGAAGKENPPVLVLHGYLGTRGAMYLLERRLLRDGFQVFSFPLGIVNTGDIRASARKVRDRVAAILDEEHGQQIDIVAHSMGGLISLYYIQELGGADVVRRLVALGTPWRGTWSSVCGLFCGGFLFPSTWQLLPGSPFVRRLVRKPLPAHVGFYSIRGRYDLLSPLSVSHLPGARDVLVPCDHSGLVTQAASYQSVFQCLTEP